MPRGHQAIRGVTRQSQLRAQITREMPARRPWRPLLASPGTSWWIGLDPPTFYQRAAQEYRARMAQTTTVYAKDVAV